MSRAPAADAVVLDARDNVATALRPLASGETIAVDAPDGRLSITLCEAIPLCHKLALRPVEAGTPIVKYGAVIGVLVAPVHEGTLVHVHNLRSARAQGTPASRESG